MSQAQRWLALVTSLPTDDAGARMRIMRTLEAMGCAVLRDGVYLLPESANTRQSLGHLAEYITNSKGGGTVLTVLTEDTEQTQALRGLFDRAGRYEDIIKTVEAIRSGFGISEPTSIAKVLSKKRREFEAVAALDYFPNERRNEAQRVLAEVEGALQALMFKAENAAVTTGIQSGEKFLKRSWATRKPLWADRLSSAWLIRRFIDPEAKLVWLNKNQDAPQGTISYGYEGARFANSGTRVTFEEMLARFGLASDPALVRIGRLIHNLDLGNATAPEAAGVTTLLQGAQRRAQSEDELQHESERTFDLLYDAYFEVPKARV